MSYISNRIRTTIRHAAIAITLTASAANAAETLTNFEIDLADIPAGSFLMGSCKGNNSNNCSAPDPNTSTRESPQHRVNVNKFQISKTEITLGQFKKFIAASGNTNFQNEEFTRHNTHGDNAPVVMVSWNDAQAFIGWLNKVAGGGYRLPSEAEWEYACRAGGKQTFCGSYNPNDVAWFDGNSDSHQHATALKQPNIFGLFDMTGNAWEWVEDCWHKDYQDAPADGSAWVSNCQYGQRVMRGGSWDDDSIPSRATNRSYGYSPSGRYPTSGFRIARNVAP